LRTERGQIEGDVYLTDELVLHGMVVGDLTVAATAVLHLHGMCTGNLVVERGGRAEVPGMVVKDVVNRGGDVDISGMVNGSVREEAGRTFVRPGAVISGQRR
jgi:cytoskeletal protein CcmA (bactofilin family)